MAPTTSPPNHEVTVQWRIRNNFTYVRTHTYTMASVPPLIWSVEVERGPGFAPRPCQIIRLKPPTGARFMLMAEVT